MSGLDADITVVVLPQKLDCEILAMLIIVLPQRTNGLTVTTVSTQDFNWIFGGIFTKKKAPPAIIWKSKRE